MAAMCIRAICERIEEVMYCYDHVLLSLDRGPEYAIFFRYLDAPRAVQERVRELLKNP
jgi:hypothetical protein